MANNITTLWVYADRVAWYEVETFYVPNLRPGCEIRRYKKPHQLAGSHPNPIVIEASQLPPEHLEAVLGASTQGPPIIYSMNVFRALYVRKPERAIY